MIGIDADRMIAGSAPGLRRYVALYAEWRGLYKRREFGSGMWMTVS